MKVILLKDVPNVGKQQQVLNVKAGYANNFLFAKKLAVPATDANMKELNEQIAKQKAILAQIKKEAEEQKNILEGKMITVKASCGPDGKLYGAVTNKDVAEALKDAFKVDIDKRKIIMDSLKNTGTYTAKIKLHAEVETTINVNVEQK